MRNVFLILACVLVPQIASAQSSENASQEIAKKTPVIFSDQPLVVDGALNETLWQRAFVSRPFVQYFPYDTSLSKSQTEIAY